MESDISGQHRSLGKACQDKTGEWEACFLLLLLNQLHNGLACFNQSLWNARDWPREKWRFWIVQRECESKYWRNALGDLARKEGKSHLVQINRPPHSSRAGGRHSFNTNKQRKQQVSPRRALCQRDQRSDGLEKRTDSILAEGQESVGVNKAHARRTALRRGSSQAANRLLSQRHKVLFIRSVALVEWWVGRKEATRAP